MAVVLTEVFPNPAGRDTGKEWVELCNQETSLRQLSGWSLRTGAKSAKLPPLSLAPKACRVIGKGQLHLPLRNSNLSLSLVDAAGKVVSSIDYPGTVPEGMSVVQAGGAAILARHPTPGSLQLAAA
ncbi:lamin tail domain-containing protein, partial [Candidatus Parcubacteria bacterium]